jgi:hypothetical protein
MGGEDSDMGDRRTLNQASLELLDFRVKQLEDERMPHRMQAAESMMKQLQSDVREIAKETAEFGKKLDGALQDFHDNQLRFMTSSKTILWLASAVGAAIVAIITWGPTALRMIAAIPPQ